MTTDSYIRGQYLKIIKIIGGGRIIDFIPAFVSRDFEVGSSSSRPPVPYGANLFFSFLLFLPSFFHYSLPPFLFFLLRAEVWPILHLSAETTYWSSVLAQGEEGNW